jgi:uncharacterized protein YyaL (SSP411 family)
LAGAKEIVIIGNAGETAVQELIAEINSLYLPNKVVQITEANRPLAEVSPLLQGKTQVNGKPTVYVCENFTCSAPVTSRSELRDLLESTSSRSA